MRILFTFIGGHGHLLPLIPLARAAQAAGHSVAFAGGPSTAAVATAEDVRAAAAAVLADPGCAQRAARLRAEFAALPGPAEAVRQIEQLT